MDSNKTVEDLEAKVMGEYAGILGGRTKALVTGGAPTSPKVIKFMEKCFACFVANSYGASEVG